MDPSHQKRGGSNINTALPSSTLKHNDVAGQYYAAGLKTISQQQKPILAQYIVDQKRPPHQQQQQQAYPLAIKSYYQHEPICAYHQHQPELTKEKLEKQQQPIGYCNYNQHCRINNTNNLNCSSSSNHCAEPRVAFYQPNSHRIQLAHQMRIVELKNNQRRGTKHKPATVNYVTGPKGSHPNGAPKGAATHEASQINTVSTLLQVLVAFLVAGFGNVGAGLILDYVKEWPVFLHVNELFILVPSLLGLKGNLEMTMAARLSTQANLGHMDNPHELLKMAKGNLALVQCQATVVSFVVAVFASLVKSMSLPVEGGDADLSASGSSINIATLALTNGSQPLSPSLPQQAALSAISNTIPRQEGASLLDNGLLDRSESSRLPAFMDIEGFDWHNMLILCASSLLTANIACFFLGTMMILVIVASHRTGIDPDNIAAPVAASLGDMTTAALLAVIAHSIYQYSEDQRHPYLALIITLFFLGMLPVWISAARSNSYTSDVITKGWTPIVIAVFISSCGGFILEYGKSRFSRLPVFQPVINGVGGNLVAVQASRLSTSLHKEGKPGQLPANFKLLTSPLEIFVSRKNNTNATTARLLLLMSIPAHLLYFFVIRAIEGESAAQVTSTFLGLYMGLAILQVGLLLILAQNLVNCLWSCSIDPDNYSTPLLTATGDLLGCAFLLLAFVTAYQFNDPYALTTV